MYNGSLFRGIKTIEIDSPKIELDKLVKLEVEQLRNVYGTDCVDVRQIQNILNIGETNAYDWMKHCPAVRQIGRRKVVPIVWMAYYLVTGTI